MRVIAARWPPPLEAPWFYGVVTACLVLAGLRVASDAVNLVALSVAVQVLNALLLPLVLGFLYALARKSLPAAYRLQGAYAVVVLIVIVVSAGFGVISGAMGIFG